MSSPKWEIVNGVKYPVDGDGGDHNDMEEFVSPPSKVAWEPKPEEPKPEEPKTEEPKTEEPKTEEPKTQSKKIFKESVKLNISKDDIGRFVGAKGANLRTYVTERTQKDLSEPARIHCSLVSNEEEVFANLKAETQEAMDTMKGYLMKHDGAIVKKKKFAGQTRFVFKAPMDHCRIAKFIGAGGKNIKNLQSDLIEEDENLTEMVYIRIREDAPMRMNNLRFGFIKTESESDEKVLITMNIKTNNREESWPIAERLVKKYVEEISQDDWADEDPFEDGGW